MHRHVCGKIFRKILSVVFYVKLLTDKQTDKRRALHNVVGGSKNYTVLIVCVCDTVGYQCEEHNNPADFFLDVMSGDSSSPSRRHIAISVFAATVFLSSSKLPDT